MSRLPAPKRPVAARWRQLSLNQRLTLSVAGAMLGVTGLGAAAAWTGVFTGAPSITAGDNSVVQTGSGTLVQGDQTVINYGYSEEMHRQALDDREARVRAEMAQAHGEELALLTRQLQAIQSDRDNLAESFARTVEELRLLRLRLNDFAALLPREQIEAAQAALFRGERAAADALLAEVQAQTADTVALAAQAAFLRGQIAESEIRWANAATHYAEAARLAPSFENLAKAREFAWRMGEYATALRLGEDLLRLARAGDDRRQLAKAMNEHALSLHALRRDTEAEPLFREALAIGRETLGPRHPHLASILNNLAELLRVSNRPAEAEPLYREALEMSREALGPRHPVVATRLNNLASLLRATNRPAEAEPLFREALEIAREALGPRHPDVAMWLNNLAGLLRATNRAAEAEPLYREALEISREALGPRHPAVAIRLNNLAGLLRATNRPTEATPLYLDSLAIFRAALGDSHPDTRTTAANTLRHLRLHAPDHPDLPALAAAFP